MSPTSEVIDGTRKSRSASAGDMSHSVYCFATDVLDEGAEAVLSNLQERAGVGGVTMAVKYHMVRDVYPHNLERRVASLGAGVYYRPALESYAGEPLSPTVSPAANGRDALEELCTAASSRAMSVGAWTVLLHSDEPDTPAAAAQHNCFGDVSAGTLCPANAAVVRFCRRMVEEICSYPIDVVRCESAHFHGFHHGHHHERLLEEIDAAALFLLGLCFCESCMARARSADVDADRFRETVKDVVEGAFSDRSSSRAAKDQDLSPERLMDVCGGAEILPYLEVRERSVAAFQDAVAEAAIHAGKRMTFIDQTVPDGARTHGALPTEAESAISRWRLGANPFASGGTDKGTELAGYVAEARDLECLVSSYRKALPDASELSLILRPGPPDCDGTENLAAKVALAEQAGCAEVSFYNYGLYRLDVLDRIRSAVAS